MSIERFIALLESYGIERLVDIRYPQFNNSDLASSLTANHIENVPMQALGGLRHARKASFI